MTSTEIITYALAGFDIPTLAILISSALGVVSGILQLAGKTGLSKIVGTVSVNDIGRVLRWLVPLVKRIYAEWRLRRLASGAAKSTTALLVLLASGCSILKSPTFWDTAQEACKVALSASPEVQAEAKSRKLTGNEWAAVLCNISDIIEPFVVETDTKAATNRALLLARPKGLVR